MIVFLLILTILVGCRKKEGNFKFHEGSRYGIFGNLLEIFENRESFDLYVCSKCGKVEFFTA